MCFPHICDDVIENYDGNHRNRVKNFINSLFCGLPDEKLHVTIDIFWNEYTDFSKNNGPFDGKKIIYGDKDIR